jgi:hypothetical protein
MQKLNLEIENLRENVNSNQANQTASAVCTFPQSSTTIRAIDIGQPTSKVSPVVSESGNHISPGVNGASVCNVSACNNVNNTNTIATSYIENVSAQTETSVDTSQYNELSLPKFSDSSKQVAVHFIRKSDEYFTLRKTPEELRLPLVFRSVSDPFTKQWMLTTYWQFKSYDDFKKAFMGLLWDRTRQELGARCINTDITTLFLISSVRQLNAVFVLRVRNFLRDGPLNRCACLTINVYKL